MPVQNMTYSELIEKIISLPIDFKLEIRNIIDHNIEETRRSEIEKNYKNSKEEFINGNLKFSSNISELKDML